MCFQSFELFETVSDGVAPALASTYTHARACIPPTTTPLVRLMHGDTNVWQWRMALATRDAAAALRLRRTASTRTLFLD